MALSNDLSKLAARAKEAETRTADAADKARTDLEREVSSARTDTEAQAERLRGTAAAHDADAANWWTAVRQSWNEHVAKAHEDVDTAASRARRQESEAQGRPRRGLRGVRDRPRALGGGGSGVRDARRGPRAMDAEQAEHERQSKTLAGTPS